MTPPDVEDDSVPPLPDPTPLSFLRRWLSKATPDQAVVALQMEIWLRDVWRESHASVGGARRVVKLTREQRWLELELERRSQRTALVGNSH